MAEGSFSRDIASHRELQQQNRELEREMPLERYRRKLQGKPLQEDPRTEEWTPPWVDDADSWWLA